MRWRLVLGVVGILGLMLASFRDLPRWVRFARSQPPGYVDEVTQYERRFAEIKPRLSPDRVYGYRAETRRVRDWGNEPMLVYDVEGQTYAMPATKAYFLTQYALAPAIVDRRSRQPPRVANLRQAVRIEGE
jgi:hypothetical protein